MTKKDYKLVAEVFKWSLQGATHVETIFANRLIKKFMESAQLHNSRFNRDIFLKACGVK